VARLGRFLENVDALRHEWREELDGLYERYDLSAEDIDGIRESFGVNIADEMGQLSNFHFVIFKLLRDINNKIGVMSYKPTLLG
jgi:hypothetical protein